MPNDPISQILEMFGVDSYSGEAQQPQRPMARRGRGGVGGAPQSEAITGPDGLPAEGNTAQMSRYSQQEASVPGDPAINSSGLSNVPEFEEAVAIFTEQNGHAPATDSDFEMGVIPIMTQLMYGADPGIDAVGNDVLNQMGEGEEER